MSNSLYKDDLAFLNEFSNNKISHLKNTDYSEIFIFKSSFKDNLWIFKFNEKKTFKIDFNVCLSDKSLLTSLKNKFILNGLKEWILNYLLAEKHYQKSPESIITEINLIVRFFDILNYFDDGSLIKNGLACITKDRGIFVIDKMLEKSDIFNTNEKIRGYINKNNLKEDFLKTRIVESGIVFKELYPNLIIVPNVKFLSLEKRNEGYIRECASFFRNNEGNLKKTMIVPIKSVLKYIPYDSLHDAKMPLKHNIKSLLEFSFSVAKIKRFQTYPSEVVFKTFQNALEFHLKYGNGLTETFVKIIKAKSNEEACSDEELNVLLKNNMSSSLKELGIKYFRGSTINIQNIRNNEYFYELMIVYYACVQFIIGALMARRVSEMISLKVGDCYDETNKLLKFKRSKSEKGLFGVKDFIALPTDEICIKMIKNLEDIVSACKGNNNSSIFSLPSKKNVNLISENIYDNIYNSRLDLMCDYFEVKTIKGERLYIRQHQLRRFFAMTFFWSNSFGKMDTLRWFMGHTDVEHLYHYITETESGEVLKSLKSQFICENIEKYEDNLKYFIKKHFNTDDYKILNSRDLEDLLFILQEEKIIQIEPVFFETDDGKKFEMIIKVKE